MGDSAAQGVGASTPENSYVKLLHDEITQELGDIPVINLSSSGARAKDVKDAQLPQLQSYEPNPRDIVLLEIGSNDVMNFDEVRFTKTMQAILAATPTQTIVADVPFFGGIRFDKQQTAQQASQTIREIARQNNLRIAPLERITTEHNSIFNYAADLFHPSDRGYRLWAEAFRGHVQKDITAINSAR